ncbi:SDR family oxidoreductase [Pseudorhodoferax sp. Leaf274]|uniref:SDR family oxidoreductase n=1 Tax=Pseudorhodoferax sp. Leaf274 TaxID=1736318 RepID=UPI00070370CE|nr:SDR family oxidoreductase [Pseudorhodoferax sp. Leaf274]KQP45621.1 3-beta hydroxysteroid dehydrogenase [Pseudorhodoferax sp. Leaf274]
MQVFVTGATGWVGSAVVQELVDAGHRVRGLARSEDKGRALAAMGAAVVHGTLDDLALLRSEAAQAEAVVHTAFNHDFSKFAENAAQDRLAIEAMGEAIGATGRPLVVTSGMAMLAPGRMATEHDVPQEGPAYPRRSETAARALAARGVRTTAVRLAPSVHGRGDHGFVPILVGIARQTGVSAYIGDGSNRWPAVHRSDAATLYRLVLEQGATAPAYHAVAEEGIAFRQIAEAIGAALGLPVAAREPAHFGWFAHFAAADMPASSVQTRALLDWQPRGSTLLADIAHAGYAD